MRRLLILSMISLSFSCVAAADNKSPVGPGSGTSSVEQILRLTPREYEKMTGKKLKLKQKIGLKIYQWKLKRELKAEGTSQKKRLGILSLIFGGLALTAAVIALIASLPGVFLFSTVLAIPGLVLGIKSVSGKNVNTTGVLGIVFSGLVLFLFTLGLIALAFSSVVVD